MDSFCNSCLKFNELTSINKDYISFDKQASKENETKIQDVNGKPWAQRCCTPLPDQIRAQMGFDGVRWGLKRWSIPYRDGHAAYFANVHRCESMRISAYICEY